MAKVYLGKILKAKMQKTAVVGIDRKTPHPVYGKLVKRTIKLLADTGDFEVKEGDIVKISQTRPVSKRKNFKILEKI